MSVRKTFQKITKVNIKQQEKKVPLHDMTHNEVYIKDYYGWSEYAGTKEERDAALVVNGYRNKQTGNCSIVQCTPQSNKRGKTQRT